MSKENIIRRPSTNTRRKTPDGNRSDSGCFDDVDVLQMNNQQSLDLLLNKKSDGSAEIPTERPLATEATKTIPKVDDVAPETQLKSDECVDDKEFRNILERLAEVTKNPGDLYRLCFSSRLSFAGLSLNVEEEGLSCQPGESTNETKPVVDEAVNNNEGTSGGTSLAIKKERKDSSTGLSGLGSIEHKDCGNSQQCVELLSMLSSFVEKANAAPTVFNQSGLGKSLLGQLSSLLCTLEGAKNDSSFLSSHHLPTFDNQEETLPSTSQQPSTQPEHSLETTLVPEHEHQEVLDIPFIEIPSNDSEDSYETFPVFDEIAPPSMSLASASAPCLPRISVGDHVTDQYLDDSSPGDSDVVTIGRRTVTPYSWDYGDIWEKELQRAQSNDSFGGDDIAGEKLMPSFEEIRDDLFHKAGFIREKDSKRRSRSADARSNYQDDPHWLVPFPGEHTGSHSPFVRTVYQQQRFPNSALTRSRSSQLLSGNSITINVDRSQGRRVKVFSEHPQLDDSWALILKDTVVETSTFRGPKPWATLKRRPSGLRRRSNSSKRPESFGSSRSSGSGEFPRTRLDSRGESESSDSPYCATSSDCLTTDDSSSITSSQYAAASSVQSSPPISNRNSACFSDNGSVGDLRRVVFQDTPSSPYSGGRSHRGHSSINNRSFPLDDRSSSKINQWEMTLDQRFSCMSRNTGVFQDPGDEHLKITTDGLTRQSYQRNANFRGSDSNIARNHSPSVSRKWSKEMTPLLVRSDSDLNNLTKVQFVGDSYSRSHISKNLRHARRQSRSPSPGTRSTHTRVVSCEIVQSDKDKQDVYTKVNLSRSEYDDDPTSNDNTLLGRTRQSWHGNSPQRSFSRTMRGLTSASPRRVNSERYACPSGLVDRRRKVFVPSKIGQYRDEKPVHAKLVEVKNMHECNPYRHKVPCDLRSSSDTNCNRYFSKSSNNDIGYQNARGETMRQLVKSFATSRNKNFGRAQALFDRPASGDVTANRHRLPPTQPLMTSPFKSNFVRKERQKFPGSNRQNAPQKNRLSGTTSGTNSTIERKHSQKSTGSSAVTKDPVIVKETSFVGPATFTKYQSSCGSQQAQRSKSFNDKDSINRIVRSKDNRRQATGFAHRDIDIDIQNKSDSDIGFPRQSQQRRRYSEGAWGASRTECGPREHLVNESYCDPRRDSVQEGTYSLVIAETARNGIKSNEGRAETSPKVVEVSHEDVDVGTNETDSSGLQSTKHDDDNNFEEELSSKIVPIKCDEKSETPQLKNVEERKFNEESEEYVKDDETGSPVLHDKETSQGPNGVNVCIDYRNKKPVSMQYYIGNEKNECRSEDATKPSRMNVFRRGKGRLKHFTPPKATADVNEDIPLDGDSPRRRLSRRDRHEQEVLCNKENDKDDKYSKIDEVPIELQSPVPYRRDKTIIYIDARSSFDSDTDSSISHHSSISSSGSDLTVILNDEQDISAGDLRQLTQNSSQIGIEISPLELDSSDDHLDSSDGTPEKHHVNPVDWTVALNDATQSANDKYLTNTSRVSNWEVTAQEPGDNQPSDFPSENITLDNKTAQAYKQDRLKNYDFKFEQKMKNGTEYKTADSPLSSNASSVESGKGIGTSFAKHVGGKGFFSRLKNFRNSFRGKKTEGKTGEKTSKTTRNLSKNVEKEEKIAIREIKTALGSRSLPIIDSNCNEMNMRAGSAFGKRAKSSVDCSKNTKKEKISANDEKPARSTYEDMRQHRGNLHNVVGVKSVSSEHLHSMRVDRRSHKMSAKSLEVLLETCI